MKLHRKEMLAALRCFADANHGIIIGEPGIGKSHSLEALAEDLLSDGIPCLLVPIDRLYVEIEDDLKRLLGYNSSSFAGFLESQLLPTNQKGIVIFDAFDAARSERTRSTYMEIFREIIMALGESWTLVVSARKYDASRSSDLQELFDLGIEGLDEKYLDPEHKVTCRHFYIDKLSDSEVEEAVGETKSLRDLYEGGSNEFRNLMSVPFNILLAEKIVSAGSDLRELGEVRSEVELLNLYWQKRIESSRNYEGMRCLMAKAVSAMIRDRVLSARRDEVYEKGLEKSWQELMSLEVLVETSSSGQRVSFSHNILFDFAVSLLAIDETPQGFVKFLSEDISRPLFLRPSIEYYFTRLWHSERKVFWDVFWAILPSKEVHIRLAARLITTAVISSEASSAADIAPILEYRKKDRKLGDEALLRLIQALRARDVKRDSVWAPILETISRDCSSAFIWDLATYVEIVHERSSPNGDAQIIPACGKASRTMLRWVWDKRKTEEGRRFDGLASAFLVPLVAKTFGTAVAESRACLEPVLKLVKEERFPIEYLYRLTDNLEKIWDYDPDFVGMVYRVVFENPETSTEETGMGTPILPMRSNRRQDFQMCHYHLKQQFPKFLRAAPEMACATAVDCLNHYILTSHVFPYLKKDMKLEDTIETFPFRGGTASYIPDHSFIWNQTKYTKDAIEIGAAFFSFLLEISQDYRKSRLLDEMLDILRDKVRVAFFWDKLLATACKNPQAFADRIFDLCIAKPIQIHDDTIYQLGNYIKAVATALKGSMLSLLQQSILELPSEADDEMDKRFLEKRRDRLLNCIPEEFLRTKQAKDIRKQIAESKAEVENEPPVTFTSSSKPFSETEWFEEQGIDPSSGGNKELFGYFEPLKRFSGEWLNKIPSEDAVQEILPILTEAYTAAKTATGANELVLTSLWTKLGECSELVARFPQTPSSPQFMLCRQILLDCSKHPSPEYHASSEFNFPAWSPAPRIEAAQGLPWLAIWSKDDDKTIDAIEALSSDNVPSVRFVVVRELWRLRKNYPKRLWEIARAVADNEANGVVQQSLCSSLHYLLPKNESCAAEILTKLSTSALEQDVNSDFLNSFVHLVMSLAIQRQNQWAIEQSNSFLEYPVERSEALSTATLHALSYIDPHDIAKNDAPEPIERAKSWILKAVNIAGEKINDLMKPEEELDETTLKSLRALFEVIDEVVTRLYFSSGIFQGGQNALPITIEERRVFYFEIRPILERVINVCSSGSHSTLFAPTAHYFLELLNGVLRFEPTVVLNMAARVVQIASENDYNLDRMAVREAAKLVESVLADHRVEVREGKPLRDLLSLLDVFANVGHREALQLVWRLDEIFR